MFPNNKLFAHNQVRGNVTMCQPQSIVMRRKSNRSPSAICSISVFTNCLISVNCNSVSKLELLATFHIPLNSGSINNWIIFIRTFTDNVEMVTLKYTKINVERVISLIYIFCIKKFNGLHERAKDEKSINLLFLYFEK